MFFYKVGKVEVYDSITELVDSFSKGLNLNPEFLTEEFIQKTYPRGLTFTLVSDVKTERARYGSSVSVVVRYELSQGKERHVFESTTQYNSKEEIDNLPGEQEARDHIIAELQKRLPNGEVHNLNEGIYTYIPRAMVHIIYISSGSNLEEITNNS